MNVTNIKSLIIKITLCAVSVFQGNAFVNGQTLYSESFDGAGFLPAGWTSVGTSNLWTRRTSGTFPTCANHSGLGMVRYGARGVAAKTIQTIASPVFDLSNRGGNSPKISLWIYRDNGSTLGDSVSIYVNTSATLNSARCIGTIARYTKLTMPDTVSANGWYNYSFTIPSSFSSATNYFLLKGIGEAGYNIYIDDVQWEAYPNLCTGTPSAGSVSATNSVICNGSGSTQLSLSGQTTGFAGISFQWKYSTSATGPFINFGGNVSTLSSGTITSSTFFKCIVSCSYSSQKDSTNVKLIKVNTNTNPVININPTTANYCQGSKVGVALQANSNSAKTYSWSPSLGLDRADTSLVYASPTATTTYVVIGSDSIGCSGQANVTVTLRQPPFVTISAPDSNLCLGDSVRLTANAGGGGNTFLWAPTGQTVNMIFAKPIKNDNYMVTVKNTFGCTTSVGKNLIVAKKPKATFDVKISGRKVNFFDSSVNGLNYEWDFGDGNGSKKSNPTYVFANDGSYAVTLIVNNAPCKADTFTKVFSISLVKLVPLNSVSNISIVPNPVKNRIVLHSLSSNLPKLCLMNSIGEILLEMQMNNNSEIIDMTEFKSGVYYISSVTNDEKSIYKFIKLSE